MAIGEPVIADRLAVLLQEYPGVRVVDPDDDVATVVLADTLPGSDAGTPVIVISDRVDGFAAMRAGAAGVLKSTVTAAQLRAAIAAVAQGLSIMPRDWQADALDRESSEDNTMPAAAPAIALTARELEVLGLIAAGASNKAIARKLGISVHTAKFHVASILAKLDATGRTDAVAQAARLGLLML